MAVLISIIWVGFLILTLIFTIPLLISALLFKIYQKQKRPQIIKNTKFSAIILDNNPKNRSLIEISGIPFIILRLNLNKKPFNVFFVNNSTELENIIKNDHVTSIFILGHGRAYGIILMNGFYRYKELKDKLHKKKEFVAQLHCNALDDAKYLRQYDDVSLGEFANKSFIKGKYRTAISNCYWCIYFFLNGYKNLKL